MATMFDRHFMCKLETTKGTDSVPTAAADSIRVDSLSISVTQNNVQRPVVKQTMGELAHLVDPDATLTAEIVVPLKGSGTPGTAPDAGVLFLACRMLETIVGGTSVTYDPSTAVEKSVSAYIYKDGLLWKMLGAVGSFSLNMEMGAIVSVTFSLQSDYLAPAVTAIPGSIAFDATAPVVAAAADVINDGAVVKAGSFTLDSGNDVQEHRSTGEHSFVVVNRAPTATFSKDSISTAAEWAALAAGADAALSFTHGAVAGNIATITAPAGRRTELAYGEKAERDTMEVSYGLYESTSDDQYSIALT